MDYLGLLMHLAAVEASAVAAAAAQQWSVTT